ncbi:hypothetical protein [Deinococcus wulumuqiensis]|uniref:hypothetical protein n=1 Tax=Deinococcus wulumuqiensis TaxID=980427 RepID=UPI00242F6C0C|nr:hypothetical protein [Deinococcus wulumuqiensis]
MTKIALLVSGQVVVGDLVASRSLESSDHAEYSAAREEAASVYEVDVDQLVVLKDAEIYGQTLTTAAWFVVLRTSVSAVLKRGEIRYPSEFGEPVGAKTE